MATEYRDIVKPAVQAKATDVTIVNTPVDIVPGTVGLSVTANGDIYSTNGTYKRKLGQDVINILKQKLVGRNLIAPKVMASPPTVTAQANNAQPASWTIPLASAVVIKYQPTIGTFDPRIKVTTPELKYDLQTGAFGDGISINFITLAIPTKASSGMQIRFTTDSPYFGIAFMSPPKVTITCDGELVSAYPAQSAVLGNQRNYLTLQFATRKMREFVIYADNSLAFGGIAIGPNDSLATPSAPDLKILGDGDSYMGLPSNRFMYGFNGEIGSFLNADCNILSGAGTGYITAGALDTFRGRLPGLSTAFAGTPDVVFIAGGINDPIGAALNTEIPIYYAALRAQYPNALLIVVGPWCPTEANGASWTTGKTNPIFSAVRAAGGLYMLLDNLNGTYEISGGVTGSLGGTAWQTGTTAVTGGVGQITSISRSANVVTVNTLAAYGVTTGTVFQIVGLGSFDGRFTATGGAASTFTYAQTGANETGPTNVGYLPLSITPGSGSGDVYFAASAGDQTHYNTNGVEYLAYRLLSAIAVAIRAF
jgi:hypothetical protein